MALHKTELVKFIHRLARLGVKINIKKSNFFINIKEDSFSLLGFDKNMIVLLR